MQPHLHSEEEDPAVIRRYIKRRRSKGLECRKLGGKKSQCKGNRSWQRARRSTLKDNLIRERQSKERRGEIEKSGGLFKARKKGKRISLTNNSKRRKQ
jgi:hypothetical protein